MVLGNFCAHDFGMVAHLVHQLRALDFSEARIVLNVSGDGKLAAGLHARDDEGFAHGTGGIDSGGPSGRSRTDDENLAVPCFGHYVFPYMRAAARLAIGSLCALTHRFSLLVWRFLRAE